MRPMIGVMPVYDSRYENVWMLDAYFDGILEAGGIPVMLPITAEPDVIGQVADQLDGFLFTGGDDVSPVLYGAKQTYSMDTYLPKDKMELQYIREILERDKPFLGICRGLQMLNVALGGTLYQDLAMERRGEFTEIHKQILPRHEKIHAVKIERKSILYDIIGDTDYEVNSLHHQAVKEPADALRVTARCPDGIIEALEHPGKHFVLGVQWHPELLFQTEAASKQLFRTFVQAKNGKI